MGDSSPRLSGRLRITSTSPLSAADSGRQANEQKERIRGWGRGQMLFTGPDQLRDQRVHVDPEPQHYIGVGTSSPEASSDVLYLWRRCGSIRAPRPRSQWAGEVGWSVSHLFSDQDYIDNRRGYPISMGTFRQAVEDSHTHNFQDAWYPGPKDKSSPVMNVYHFTPYHQNRPNIKPIASSIIPHYDYDVLTGGRTNQYNYNHNNNNHNNKNSNNNTRSLISVSEFPGFQPSSSVGRYHSCSVRY